MALKLITPPSIEPVSLAEAKTHCSVTHSQWDTLIQTFITASRMRYDGKDGILGRALVTQTWELQLDAFPCGPVKIPLPPLRSIVSIKYLDVDGVEQTMLTTDYVVDTASEPGWVSPSVSWPTTYSTLNAVKIRFECGYGAAADVPAPIRSAMLLMIGDALENREASIVGAIHEINPAVNALTFPYRILDV